MEKKLFASRHQATEAIRKGRVLADGRPVLKPSSLVSPGEQITLLGKRDYVSRGGYKLEKALRHFKIKVKDKVALDVGSSTGGFTDCLLQNGARQVIAVDVGRGQLDWSLRNDPRVYVLERTNIRCLRAEELPELADVATIDVSFISVTKFTRNLASLLKPKAELVVLVKPQFEAGRELVGRKGVVRKGEVHQQVLLSLWQHYKEEGFRIRGLTYSPLRGPQGNLEFLLYASSRKGRSVTDAKKVVARVVEEAHSLG